MTILDSLFNFGSEERISIDSGSIFYSHSPSKISKFLHFAIEGRNFMKLKDLNVDELASISDDTNLGKELRSE